jgi:spore coat protein CotF
MMNNQPSTQPTLSDEDVVSVILSDLKRVTREYTTATTESVCPEIRQMFTQLQNNTLTMQGELFTAMQQNNMYNASSPALKQELDKQFKQYQQTQQKTTQFVQQTQTAQAHIPPGATGQNTIPAYQ